jgi:two-component system response regulator WspF
VKVAIVNDMPMAVEALRRALAYEPAHEVIWVAADGEEAVRRCAEQRPDVLLMDLVMPKMDGVEATRQIMANTPCAIVIVTVDREQNLNRVFEAMGHGALDVVDTPAVGAGNGKEAAALLLRKIVNIGWLIGHRTEGPHAQHAVQRDGLQPPGLVAIGSSAGGPAALETLLKALPATFPAALVLVQHVDEVFAAGMADWLGTAACRPVRLAREGDRPQSGDILLAGTNNHLRVLLTGMGRDGAQGLKRMRERGHLTIAQDQHTSAVFGMPKAAVAIDAAVEVRPLEHIAPRLMDTFA